MDERKKETLLEMVHLYRMVRAMDESPDNMNTCIDIISKYMSAYAGTLAYEYGKILMRYLIDRDDDKAITQLVIASYEGIVGG